MLASPLSPTADRRPPTADDGANSTS